MLWEYFYSCDGCGHKVKMTTNCPMPEHLPCTHCGAVMQLDNYEEWPGGGAAGE